MYVIYLYPYRVWATSMPEDGEEVGHVFTEADPTNLANMLEVVSYFSATTGIAVADWLYDDLTEFWAD